MAAEVVEVFLAAFVYCVLNLGSLAFIAFVLYQREAPQDFIRAGVFIVKTWSRWRKDLVGMGFIVFSAVPMTVVLTAMVVGEILGMIEQWEVGAGFAYVVGHYGSRAQQLTEKSPSTPVGQTFDVAASLILTIVSAALLGLIALSPFVAAQAKLVQPTLFAIFRCIFLYVPLLVVILALSSGAVISVFEVWSMRDGFLFMVGVFCNLGSPLTDVNPITPVGTLMTVLASSMLFSLTGVVVGLVGRHPLTSKGIQLVQGSPDAPVVEPISPLKVRGPPRRTHSDLLQTNSPRCAHVFSVSDGSPSASPRTHAITMESLRQELAYLKHKIDDREERFLNISPREEEHHISPRGTSLGDHPAHVASAEHLTVSDDGLHVAAEEVENKDVGEEVGEDETQGSRVAGGRRSSRAGTKKKKTSKAALHSAGTASGGTVEDTGATP
mmetsp:Transcript_64604/g.179689  ORF Transcript_64604/g.179689 Transcript_64604/m.179689 type:complete len:439 (+) Transcript_64604:99-1415(+)